MYIVQTCMYMFIQVYARFDSYKHVHIMYKHVHTCLFHISYLHSCMSRYVLLMFRVQMATYISRNVQTSLNCVHTLMYPFDFSFLFCPAGWPVGRDQLLPGVTPTQVQAHQFNRHQPLVFLPPRPPAFLAGLGADPATSGAAAGSSPPAGEQPLQRQRGDQPLPRQVLRCGGAARVLDAGLVLGRCSSVLLVLRIGASRSWSWGNRWRPEPP